MDAFLNLIPENVDKLKKIDEIQKISQNIKDDPNIPWVEKYRPKSLDDVVLQKEAVQALKTTKETGKMQHLLFYGPPGTGKTSTILAVNYYIKINHLLLYLL